MGNPHMGGMYARPNITSPMAQLTCLLPSQPSSECTSNASTNIRPPKGKNPRRVLEAINLTRRLCFAVPKTSGLGVPGKPGSGALTKRLEQLSKSRQQRRQAGGTTRPDLGTVATAKKVVPQPEPEQRGATSTLGTLSSLLFGRKGGLF